MRILLIEDEPRMLELLRNGLREEGHSVMTAEDGIDGYEIAIACEFEALVLDLMLPGRSGYEIARSLRTQRNPVPIIMLTARDSEEHIIQGLNLGADDYLTKPFSFVELLARLRAITRRATHARSATLHIGDLMLDSSRHEVSRAGELIHLSRTEFLLLECLMQQRGNVVSRQLLIGRVWGYDREVENNTLDAFIRLLRVKIGDVPEPTLLHTVRGVGYRIDPALQPASMGIR